MSFLNCLKTCLLGEIDFDNEKDSKPKAKPLSEDPIVVTPVEANIEKPENIKEPPVPKKDDVFEKATKIVGVNEGGWNKVRGDSGGETVFGIARNYHPKWSGWKTVDQYANKYGRGTSQFIEFVNADSQLYEEAKNYFEANFWQPANCDKLPEEIAIIVYDMEINSGNRSGQRTLQRALNDVGIRCSVDGVIGPKTIATTEKAYEDNKVKLIEAILKRRYNYYLQIISRKSSQKKFWKGWVNRLRYLAQKTLEYVPSFLSY